MQSGNSFVGSVPNEICQLDLDTLIVDCDSVDCDCCTGCEITPPIPLYELLVAAYPDGEDALQDPSSPQSAAFEWMLSSANSGVTSNRRLMQRYALATLYYSTQGSIWETSTNWLSSNHECTWYTAALDPNDICDSSGNYVRIELPGNNLLGILPMELLMLSRSLGK